MYWRVDVAHASPKKIQVVGAAMTWRSPVLMVILQMRVQHYLICMSGVWDWKGVTLRLKGLISVREFS